MRKQPITQTSGETTGVGRRPFQRNEFPVVLWLGLILLSFNLVVSAAQEKPATQTPDEVNALIKQLAAGADPGQRIYAAEVLSQLGDRKAVKSLIAALQDTEFGFYSRLLTLITLIYRLVLATDWITDRLRLRSTGA